jgi:hypothetical protein
MTTLTPELRQAVEQAGDQPVAINDPQTNTEYILLRADVYRHMREVLEEDEDRREKEAGRSSVAEQGRTWRTRTRTG